MYTICTGCQRQFRIHAQHLSAANGLVKCGYCGEQFNALEFLSDEPLKPQDHETVPVEETTIEEAAFIAEDENDQEEIIDIELEEYPVTEDEIQAKDELASEQEQQALEQSVTDIEIKEDNDIALESVESIEEEQTNEEQIEEPEPEQEQEQEEPEFHLEDEKIAEEKLEDFPIEMPESSEPDEPPDTSVAEAIETPEFSEEAITNNIVIEENEVVSESADSPNVEVTPEINIDHEDLNQINTTTTKDISLGFIEEEKIERQLPEEFPEELLNSEPERPGRTSFYLWGFGCVLLILIVGAQFAWFNRDQLYKQYPQAIPYVKQICERVECDIYREVDFSQIEVSHDIRFHPNFDNTVLVNIVMTNRIGKKIDYPNLHLSLYDTDERMVSYRQFQAEDYLDDTFNIEGGMEPDIPVHFVLELSGYMETVANYKFDFF